MEDNRDSLDDQLANAFLGNDSNEENNNPAQETPKEEIPNEEVEQDKKEPATEEENRDKNKEVAETKEEEVRDNTSTEEEPKKTEVDYDSIIFEKSGGRFKNWEEFENFKNQSEEAASRLKQIEEKPKNERLLAIEHYLETNPNASLSDFEKIDKMDVSTMSEDDAVQAYLQLHHGLTSTEAKDLIKEQFNRDEEGQFEKVTDKVAFNEMHKSAVSFINQQKESLYAPIRGNEGDKGNSQENQREVLTSENIANDIFNNVKSVTTKGRDFEHTYSFTKEQQDKVASEVLKILEESNVEVTTENIAAVREIAEEQANRLFKAEILTSAINSARAEFQKEQDKKIHNPSALNNEDNNEQPKETQKDSDDILFERIAGDMV